MTRFNAEKDRSNEARIAVQKAREALRDNNRHETLRWAERAAKLAPQMEDPWLLLAAVASPRASVEYIQKALKINPNSTRAQSGMMWAMQRLSESTQTGVVGEKSKGKLSARTGKTKRSLLIPILLFGVGCILCAGAAWFASTSHMLAPVWPIPAISASSTRAPSWAQAHIPKPTATQTPESPTEQPTLTESTATPIVMTSLPTSTEAPEDTPTLEPTQMAVELPTETFVPTAEPTWSGSFSMQIVPDAATPEIQSAATAGVLATAATANPNTASNGGERWIDVNLSQQTVYAYEGDIVVKSFLVSTGTQQYPTITGKFHIYVKLRTTDMSGADYFLPNVPYTMYFYKGYGLHGTYWHHNFGTPMSHGCINLSIPDSEWLYNFSSVGTLVNVHN